MDKPHKLGNVNGAFPCNVYKGDKLVGMCIDTPNSIAYAVSVTDADYIIGGFRGKMTREDLNREGFNKIGKKRIDAKGWFETDEEANFLRN